MSDVRTATGLARVVHLVASPVAGVTDAYSAAAGLGVPVSTPEVVINRGARDGVKLGDRFLVFGWGPHIVDPDTGDDLGKLELVRGRGEVVHLQEHLATIRTLERQRTRPAKRTIREAVSALSVAAGLRGKVIEEELAPEAEVPFEAVRLGDLAKPI
jgi:hypothetical protein